MNDEEKPAEKKIYSQFRSFRAEAAVKNIKIIDDILNNVG